MNKSINTKFKAGAVISLLSLLLSACGTSSGPENTFTPDSTDPGGSSGSVSYTGPAADDADTQAFKTNVWDNLVSANRCGTCHGTDGQSPTFVRTDDINLAYDDFDAYVDRDTPQESAIVAKVGEGHNCWLGSDAACADTMQSYIERWLGGSSSSSNEIVLNRLPETQIRDPGASKSFPEDSTDYQATVYPIVTQYCDSCHRSDGPIMQVNPYLASDDADASYASAQSKIDLDTPTNSRLYLRLAEDRHNCWDDCTANAAEMLTAIEDLASGVPTTAVDPDLEISKALTLVEGIAANAGGRFEENVIALYEFKTMEGNIAYDTSGVEPAINLSISGDVNWVGGWGIQIVDGRAQGSTDDSAKLRDMITASGEYSIEAWVVPGNVTQEEAHIVSYSAGNDARNFTLGQTLYNYDFMHRSSTTDFNGQDQLSTNDDDERLQATLQHVVVTFAPGEGRRIYVNGEYTGDMDPVEAGSMAEWNDSYAFVLGNETSGDRLWEGTFRMVAIHNRALTQEQITANYDVGVGQKFFLLFSVADLVDIADAYVVFEVSQFDSYSYLFTEPFFVILDDEDTATPSNIPLQGMRIGINGKEAAVGQAYENIDIVLDETSYTLGSGQPISERGTIIALEQGSGIDEFFLSFERIGDNENAFSQVAVGSAPTPADLDPVPDIGLKTFDEINASMSAVTGVPITNAAVENTFNTVRQALPASPTIEGFLSSHQMAITQLSIQYCDALIEDNTYRGALFPSFDFGESYTTAFDADGKTNLLTPLLNAAVGENITTEPAVASFEEILWDGYTRTVNVDGTDTDFAVPGLVTTLTACSDPDNPCGSDRTETVAKAICAAVLGSAVTLVQ